MADIASPSESLPVTQNSDPDNTSSRGAPSPVVPGSLPVPTIRGDTDNHKPSIATTLLNAAKQFPLTQERQGDDKLDRAREMMDKFGHMIADNDLTIIREKISR
jgi:hypothetical protein